MTFDVWETGTVVCFDEKAIARKFMRGACMDCLAIMYDLPVEEIVQIVREEFKKRKEKQE